MRVPVVRARRVSGAPGASDRELHGRRTPCGWGAYLNPHNPTTQSFYQPESVDVLVETTLRDLAQLNGVSYDFLRSELVDYHAYDFYGSAYSNGAFAMFGAGQFSSLMPWLMRPGRRRPHALRRRGPQLRPRLDHRRPQQRLARRLRDPRHQGWKDKQRYFIEQWSVIDEVDMGWYDWSPEGLVV